ncbi:unnamed protein product [Camellia sinensis]
MRDNSPQPQPINPTKTLPFPSPPPPPPPQSPSRKRLLSNPNPNPNPNHNPKQCSTSSDSSLSSDSSSERFRKKTRDLPNFSDCHCCGLHINTSNPKNKLQTLDSVWRIVLLCKKCIERVESAELCSYCFSKADSDCYRCWDCERCIHRECVAKYRWSSYCCLELGFSVCVDCWVPKLLANSNRVYKRRNNSRVSKSLEDVVIDAKSVVKKKTAVVAKAKENALRKAMVARKVVELANSALELVAKKDDNGATVVVDDAELAFQLHRAMNSSPRISKNFCLLNSSHLPVPRIRYCDGDLSVRSSGSRVSSHPSATAPNNKLNENVDATVSEPVYVSPLDSSSHICLGNLKQDGLAYYTRRCKKEKECRVNGGAIVGDCNFGDDNNWIVESQTCQKQVKLEYDLDDTRYQSQLTCDGNATVFHEGRCNGKPDRYMLKYSKRPVGFKPISNSEPKILYGDSSVESKDEAVGLPLNCSEECRTLSDTTFQSCTTLPCNLRPVHVVHPSRDLS